MASILSSAPSTHAERAVGRPCQPAPDERGSEHVPVGLKNVQNICYFNSLVQVYFHLRPAFLQAVMSAAADERKAAEQQQQQAAPVDANGAAMSVDKSLSSSLSPHIAFVLALQRLFAFLHLSQRKYLDPMTTVTALFAASVTRVRSRRCSTTRRSFTI